MPREKLMKNKINMKLYGSIFKFIFLIQKLYWKETFEHNSVLHVVYWQKRSNQSILKEINSEYSLEGLMLKLQYFGPWCKDLTHWKRPWCWERLRAGVVGDNRGQDGWMASSTPWTWVWVDSVSWTWTGRPGVLRFMGSWKSQTTLSEWTELIDTRTMRNLFIISMLLCRYAEYFVFTLVQNIVALFCYRNCSIIGIVFKNSQLCFTCKTSKTSWLLLCI